MFRQQQEDEACQKLHKTRWSSVIAIWSVLKWRYKFYDFAFFTSKLCSPTLEIVTSPSSPWLSIKQMTRLWYVYLYYKWPNATRCGSNISNDLLTHIREIRKNPWIMYLRRYTRIFAQTSWWHLGLVPWLPKYFHIDIQVLNLVGWRVCCYKILVHLFPKDKIADDILIFANDFFIWYKKFFEFLFLRVQIDNIPVLV